MLKAYVAAQTRLEQFKDYMRDLREDDSGAALVEYALIVGLVAIACVTAITTVGKNLNSDLKAIGGHLGTVK